MGAPKVPGSVWQDKTTGKWKSLVTLPKDNGRRRRRETTHATERDARAAHKKAVYDLATRTEAPVSHQTVAEYGEWWLENEKRGTIRDGTLGDYRYRLERWIYPTFGDLLLASVTAQAVSEWRTRLRKQGESVAAINGARTIFRQLMQHAVNDGRIERNPVTLAKAATRRLDDPTAVRLHWSLEESRDAIRVLRDDPLEAFVAICLFTGLRRGEALGLKWSDFDMTELRFSVRRSLKANRTFDDGKWSTTLVFENPKTKASMRALVVQDSLVEILTRHRARQVAQAEAAGGRWIDNDLVFATSIGTPINPSNLRQRYIKALEGHGLRFIRIHDLRHTYACLALEAEHPLEAVSQALGHTDVNITKSIYAPMVPVLSDRVGLGVGDLLSTMNPVAGDLDRELLDLPVIAPSRQR